MGRAQVGLQQYQSPAVVVPRPGPVAPGHGLVPHSVEYAGHGERIGRAADLGDGECFVHEFGGLFGFLPE